MLGKFVLFYASILLSFSQTAYKNVIKDYTAKAGKVECGVEYNIKGKPEGVYVEKYYIGSKDNMHCVSLDKKDKKEIAECLKENLNQVDSAGLFKTYSIREENGNYYYCFHSPHDEEKTKALQNQTRGYKKEMQAVINSWGPDLTDLQKLEKINRFIIDKLTYNEVGLTQDVYKLQSPSGYWQNTWPAAYEMNTALCSGYAELFDLMAKLAGLESKVVSNDVHAWNVVKINGEWRHFDTTWNDYLNQEKLYFNLSFNELNQMDDKLNQAAFNHTLGNTYLALK